MKLWKPFLDQEFEKPYFKNLNQFLNAELNSKTIFPAKEEIFRAFKKTPLEKVKVVILGQDPYHGPGQAHGLCFSVPKNIKLPPSLKNIFKELSDDLKIPMPESGDLTKWADQGVLLLNTVLTVEAGKAGSHQNQGWEIFTDKMIEVINENCDHVVFILWGSHAQKKSELIDQKKHLIISNVHPSPLSVYRGFFGSKPFSQANEWLESKGITPVDWTL